jgi:hypothetical protein
MYLPYDILCRYCNQVSFASRFACKVKFSLSQFFLLSCFLCETLLNVCHHVKVDLPDKVDICVSHTWLRPISSKLAIYISLYLPLYKLWSNMRVTAWTSRTTSHRRWWVNDDEYIDVSESVYVRSDRFQTASVDYCMYTYSQPFLEMSPGRTLTVVLLAWNRCRNVPFPDVTHVV